MFKSIYNLILIKNVDTLWGYCRRFDKINIPPSFDGGYKNNKGKTFVGSYTRFKVAKPFGSLYRELWKARLHLARKNLKANKEALSVNHFYA